jgi:hypothetical protein
VEREDKFASAGTTGSSRWTLQVGVVQFVDLSGTMVIQELNFKLPNARKS